MYRLFIIMVIGLALITTGSSADPDGEFEVPENYMQRVQLIDKFKNEIALYAKQIEECKNAVRNIRDLSLEYSRVDMSIFKFDDLASDSSYLNQFFVRVINTLMTIEPKQFANDGIQREVAALARDFNWLTNKIRGFYIKKDISDKHQKTQDIIRDNINRCSIAVSNIDSIKASLNNLIGQREKDLNELYNKKDEKFELHMLAIKVGIPSFALTLIGMLSLSHWYRYKKLKAIRPKGSADCDEHSSEDTLAIITVFLLTMTILIMGLSHSIPGEVLGTLLGGISGYVLSDQLRRRRNSASPSENNSPQGT